MAVDLIVVGKLTESVSTSFVSQPLQQFSAEAEKKTIIFSVTFLSFSAQFRSVSLVASASVIKGKSTDVLYLFMPFFSFVIFPFFSFLLFSSRN